MRSHILVVTLITSILAQPLLAEWHPGVVASSATMAVGGVIGIVGASMMWASSDEEYCPAGTQRAISGSHDCSYMTCAVYVYQGQTYYCQTYYSDYSGASQSCTYTGGGYNTCVQYVSVPQTCYDYACQDNSTHAFTPFLHRKQLPRYDNSKIAAIVGAGIFGGGLVGLIISCLVRPGHHARHAPDNGV